MNFVSFIFLQKVETLLPPPTFSGDALSFLTKFMGHQTSTTLNVVPTQAHPTGKSYFVHFYFVNAAVSDGLVNITS